MEQQCAKLNKQVESLVEAITLQNAGTNLLQREIIKSPDARRTEFRPTLDMIGVQPTHMSQMDNDAVASLGYSGNHSAHKERLLREIMVFHNVSWDEAHAKLFEMDLYNEKLYWFYSFPYRVGISGAILCAAASVLLVFYRPIAEFYGRNVVGEDLPEGVNNIDELSTNQVGAWTWSWMEPVIGTGCFVLLCCQFARAQMWKLNMRPYTEMMQRYRANRLADKFPEYDRGIVRSWAKHMPIVDWTFFPTYRRFLGSKGL